MLAAASWPCSCALRQDFEANAPVAVKRQRIGGAVAGGKDVRVAGAQRTVDGNAVFHRKARRLRQFGVRHRADADDQQARRDDTPVFERDTNLVRPFFDTGHLRAAQHLNPFGGVAACDDLGDLRRHAAGEDPRQALHKRHRRAALSRACGKFQADEAAAENGDMAALRQMRTDALRIVMAAQRGNAVAIGGARQSAWPRAGRKQQFVIGDIGAVIEQHPLAGTVDGENRAAAEHADVGFGIAFCRGHELRAHPRDQRLLGERRALIGQMGLAADKGDCPGKPFFPQREGCARAAFASADDDESRHGEILPMRARDR